MRLRIVSILFIGALSVTLTGGCVTRFQPPPASAPHATLAFPSQGEGATVGILVEAVEVNQLARPQTLIVEHLRVPLGEVRLLARAAEDNKHGTCELRFPAVAGATYEIGAGREDGNFVILASRDGRSITECEAAGTISPTPLRV
ncbi:MAG TPA: hypothetical protein VMQ83_08185, partial [Gammaproteobacteria bacterium]|nr:hypothetical protein [Gammaproteobacteria bacterium]